MEYKGYIGTYSSGEKGGIFRFSLEDDKLNILKNYPIENPSFLCRCQNGRAILAVSETGEYMGENGGSVAVFTIDADGDLSKTCQKPTFGKDPCFIDQLGDSVFIANYTEGTADIYNFDGEIIGECEKIIVHKGKGIDPIRQESAHIHCTRITPDKKYFAICDLGLDKVFIYDLKGKKHSRCDFPKGAGPRHIEFGENCAYVLTELSSEVYTLSYRDGILQIKSCYSLLPKEFTDFNNSAAIKLSPDGKFLTCSNRGHNSLTVFAVKDNFELDFIFNTKTFGDFPRDFAYTPDGKYIVALNQNSENAVVFTVNENGTLERLKGDYTIPKPVFIMFDK